MKGKYNIQPVSQSRTRIAVITFLLLLVTVVSSACNLPFAASEKEKGLPDPNARMYQMYFDTSADPAQNELQTRRFLGHLHLADIEAIFGDIQSLPMDENCNYVGGPVLDDEGTSWFATITPDLVGVNLVSVTPDGTKSSAFDLDGDRIVDILDMRFRDNRRISFVTELMGLEVFREWLEGVDPFCNTEVARQLGLPDLGCNERGDGSSAGGSGSFAGSGIVDIVDMICSEYDTGPMAGIMDLATRGQPGLPPGGIYRTSYQEEQYNSSDGGSSYRFIQTFVTTDYHTGEIISVEKVMTDILLGVGPNEESHVIKITRETVNADGLGTRTTQRYNPDGSPAGPPEEEDFLVDMLAQS